jgi:hypothetical protein
MLLPQDHQQRPQDFLTLFLQMLEHLQAARDAARGRQDPDREVQGAVRMVFDLFECTTWKQARGFGRHGSDIRRSSCRIRKIVAGVGSRPRRPSLKPDHNLIGKFPSAAARRATIFALFWPSPALSNPDH